jgi:hypothetical protein
MPPLLSTDQAAALVGRHPSRLRHWWREGRLHPVNPGHRPLEWDAADVWRAARAQLPEPAATVLRGLADLLDVDTPDPTRAR